MGHFRPFTDTWGWHAQLKGEFMADWGFTADEIRAERQKIAREGIAAQADAEKCPKRKRRRAP